MANHVILNMVLFMFFSMLFFPFAEPEFFSILHPYSFAPGSPISTTFAFAGRSRGARRFPRPSAASSPPRIAGPGAVPTPRVAGMDPGAIGRGRERRPSTPAERFRKSEVDSATDPAFPDTAYRSSLLIARLRCLQASNAAVERRAVAEERKTLGGRKVRSLHSFWQFLHSFLQDSLAVGETCWRASLLL